MSSTSDKPDTPPPLRIMIVEDNAFVALDLSDMLEEAGFQIIACVGTTADALRVLESKRPDMAVLDFNLRQQTSHPIAARLAELDIPYMFLSGQSRDTIGTDQPLMRKPFRPDALIDALHDLNNKAAGE